MLLEKARVESKVWLYSDLSICLDTRFLPAILPRLISVFSWCTRQFVGIVMTKIALSLYLTKLFHFSLTSSRIVKVLSACSPYDVFGY